VCVVCVCVCVCMVCVCVCVCVQTDTPPLEDAKRLLCCTEGYRHFGIRRMLNTSHTVS
jgi:hypothetical protein